MNTENTGNTTMEKIMNSSFGEASNTIRASFKKTVFMRQYETEVVEMESTLTVDKNVTGAERMFMSAILQAQLEYSAYVNLAFKGLITKTELDSRRDELVNSVEAIKNKAEQVLGKSLDEYLDTHIG